MRLTQATLLLVLVCGCRKDVPVESIHLNMWETLDSSARTLRLNCRTVQGYGCCNYGIGYTLDQNAGRIGIAFEGIIVPDICLTSPGPATATLNLGTLSPGTYDLDIQLGQGMDRGQLVVTQDEFAIALDGLRQVQVLNSPLRRIPEHTIWGKVGYHSEATAPLVQTFLDSLQLLGATPQTYQAGDYGYFQIDQSGQIAPNGNSGYYFVRPFLYNYTGPSAVLRDLVRNFGAAHDDAMKITLNTTKGEVFRSWVP